MRNKVTFGKLKTTIQEEMVKRDYNPLTDSALWSVILGNILAMVMAFVQKWPLHEILWIYWAQSVIIGIVNVFRILSLKEFSTEGFKSNGVQPPETPETKLSVAGFFALHYGFFHFMYAVFLWNEMPITKIPPEDMMLLVICVLGFASSHFYDLVHNLADDFKDQKPNIGAIMFYPYLRIIPMHVTVMVGSLLQGYAVIPFMIIKMFADAAMHMVERNLFRQPPGKGPLQTKD